jgi:hypothetical protein
MRRERTPARYSQIGHCGCGCGCGVRRFFTREEEIEMPESCKKQLQREIAGVEKRIEDLRG